jgi:hypothetical protein
MKTPCLHKTLFLHPCIQDSLDDAEVSLEFKDQIHPCKSRCPWSATAALEADSQGRVGAPNGNAPAAGNGRQPRSDERSYSVTPVLGNPL